MTKGGLNIAYYLSRYVGTYRVKSEIDLDTNDFPRDNEGRIEDDNVYIKCANNARIFHYGGSKLEYYIPSIIRGKNILKAIAADKGLSIESYGSPVNYDSLYEDIQAVTTIFDIWESSEEIGWKFSAAEIDYMAKFLKPLTNGASISPFSTKNLPKKKYEINKAQMDEYRAILAKTNLDDKLVVGRITSNFIVEFIPKKHKEYRKTNMKALMKKEMLKSKEFIHSLGFWNEYLQFLEKELKK